MNYLAHLFLSGNDQDLRLGNFIADSVRGAQILLFPERVQLGIKLHRSIDAFTDAHPVVAETKARLRLKYSKYAGVVADVYYDHFLATDFTRFSSLTLAEFAQVAYAEIQARPHLLPLRVQQFLPFMVQHNWLVSYAQITGITSALVGLSKRTTFASGMETAGQELQDNYLFYQQEFNRFFPDLQTHVTKQLILIGN